MTEKSENTDLNFKIGQVGIVVKDIEKASAFLQKIGIGPFEIMDVETKTGKLKVAMFQQGELMVELIQPIEGDNFHSRWLKEKGQGINHILYITEDFDGDFQKLKELGLEILFQDKALGGQFAYFDAQNECGLVLELGGAV
jgi:hypothetical protein